MIPQVKSAEQINRIPAPSPVAGDDGKALVYDHATASYVLDSPAAGGVAAADVLVADAEGNFTATDVEGALTELFTSVSDGKDLIATAITDKGGTASGSGTFTELASAIDSLSIGGNTVLNQPQASKSSLSPTSDYTMNALNLTSVSYSYTIS
jgi:hypothetical protein